MFLGPGFCLGLPPHTRGSHLAHVELERSPRSTPAHAGKPGPPTAREIPSTVYPRTRGEAANARLRLRGKMGLPPHTRGSRYPSPTSMRTRRSTPAHAGKPRPPSRSGCPPRVYPRTRGEATLVTRSCSFSSGLPPHTRGSRDAQLGQQPRGGSTPAHAGKPRSSTGTRAGSGVYPRTRGEASAPARPIPCHWGLPPHTRGSLLLRHPLLAILRSTPAHAGKPLVISNGTGYSFGFAHDHQSWVGYGS